MNRALLAIALAAIAASSACQRDEIVSVDPDDRPGPSATTVEALLGPDQLESWVDTVFSGFTRASSADFLQVEQGTSGVPSRGLVRFPRIEDTVFVVDTLSPALRYEEARVVFDIDTSRTQLADGGTTVQLRVLDEDWDAGSATWEFAVDSAGASVLWSTPGGALGATLSELQLSELTDSIIFDLGAISDSLLLAWRDTTRLNTGFAIVVSDSGRLVLENPQLRYKFVPELLPDTAIELRELTLERTFIFDGSAAVLEPGVLRLGGIEGWRSFAELSIPDSIPVNGSSELGRVRGASVGLAELVLVSRSPPAPPFAAEVAFVAVAVELVDDFGRFGAKTPVGDLVLDSDATIDPDSLDLDSVLRFDLTELIQDWADTPIDSISPRVRIALRALPEAATFGFWEFGAEDGDADLTPTLRIVFTPETEFPVP